MTDYVTEQAEMLKNRLIKNRRRVGHAARRLKVSCYRLYDGDIPDVPLYVDCYEGKIHVSVLRRRRGEEEEAEEDRWADAMVEAVREALELSDDQLFVKTRKRQKGKKQYEKFGQQREEFIVEEAGLKFIVNLSDYLDTGLFLDHRITRQMVREEAQGKDVLNLFAYTGAFSVYAAAGGARSTATVDMSNTYLRWARKNMAENGFKTRAHRFERVDILSWLKEVHSERAERYDLVVFDPPTFSRSKKMDRDLDIQRDHAWMLRHILTMCRPGGVIYFSTNFRDFSLRDHGLNAAIEEITEQTVPFDFQYSRPHRCWKVRKDG